MNTRRTRPAIAMVAALGLVAIAQDLRFEVVQRDVFGTGGAFVNAWADYDLDGDLDLFVGFDGAANRLYRNQNGVFEDVAAAAGVADARPARAAAWGDADGDGDPDLLVGFTPIAPAAAGDAAKPAGSEASGSVLRFYRNERGTFRDDTTALGLVVAAGAVRQPAWVDYDADGDLDLFVAFRDKPNALFRNEKGGFMDIAPAAGLADARRTVGAVWFDYDEDGDLDLIVGNMDGDANGLFVQHNGKFVDLAAEAGVLWGGRAPKDPANGTVRPCAADVNGDGHVDLFFANYGKNGLFLNRGDGTFTDVSPIWKIDIDARHDSCAFADMDNDGDLDLYVNGTITGGKSYPDYLFRNTGTQFEDVTPAEIASPSGDHGVEWADFDLDGDMDLALTGSQKDSMHLLLRNALSPALRARALHVRVLDARGVATLPGTTVTIAATGANSGPQSQTRLTDAGSGYNSQNSIPLHFTLPAGKSVKLSMTVRRPGGGASVHERTIEPDTWRQRVLELRIPN